jgi:hypothetical protein
MKGIVALALLSCVPLVVASQPAVTYIDGSSGILVPTGGVREAPDVESIDSASFSWTADDCHTELRVSVSWEPASYGATVMGRSVAVDTVLHAKLIDERGAVLDERTRAGGTLSFTRPVAANASVQLVLGADLGVDVHARALVMGWAPASGPACPG